MSPSVYGAFVFTVLLLAITAYSVMGGLPLLILRHDAPTDARFIRAFFGTYYRVAVWLSLGAVLCYLLWGRPVFAAGAAGVGAANWLLRGRVGQAMQGLSEQIAASEQGAVSRFRRVHAAALLANLLVLGVVVTGVLRLSREFA